MSRPHHDVLIPPGDFAHVAFDRPDSGAFSNLLILYSTPRSGSTMACDLIRRSGLCVPHEYFQPYQYRPALEERWSVPAGNDAAYLTALSHYRTGPNGWLGVNLHSHHVPAWEKAYKSWPAQPDKICELRIRRRDQYAQAVSYYVAQESGVWSSAFGRSKDVPYAANAVFKYYTRLQDMEARLDKTLKNRTVPTLWYEDLVVDPSALFDAIGTEYIDECGGTDHISRQVGSKKKAYVERFRKDMTGLRRVRVILASYFNRLKG